MWRACNAITSGLQRANVTIVVLPAMRSDKGDQFCLDLHLSGAASTAQGRSRHTMCQLWMQRMRLERLITTPNTAQRANYTYCDKGQAWSWGLDLRRYGITT